MGGGDGVNGNVTTGKGGKKKPGNGNEAPNGSAVASASDGSRKRKNPPSDVTSSRGGTPQPGSVTGAAASGTGGSKTKRGRKG